MSDTFVFPASSVQRRFWLLQAWDPADVAYNVPTAFRIRGPLCIQTFDRAVAAVAERHDALRTTFDMQDGQIVQVVHVEPTIAPTAVNSLMDLEQDARDAEARRIIAADIHRPFDLARGPLLRTLFVRTDSEAGTLVLTAHHIVCDGWALDVLLDEISADYNALRRQTTAGVPPLAIQYPDYTIWQRDIEETNREPALAYWLRQLADAAAALDLAPDFPRPARPTGGGTRAQFRLPADVVDAIRGIGLTGGATLFMTLLAAFQALLHRYSDQDDVLVAVPAAGRNDTSLHRLIGCFVNTLALRGDLSGDPTFLDLLSRTRAASVEAFAHADLPFDVLVDRLHRERSASRAPLCQVAFVLEQGLPPLPALDEVAIDAMPLWTDTAKFDLTLTVAPDRAGWTATWEYRTDLFQSTTIARLAEHYERVLRQIAAAPARRLSELDLLTSDERHQVVVEWNDTGHDYPRDASIHELFASEAAKRPDDVAVIQGERRVTRGWVNAEAGAFARRLQAAGVRPGDVIGVCTARSPETIVALIAILKAGAAYLPLSRRDPVDRQVLILRDAGARVLVTEPDLVKAMREKAPEVVTVDLREAVADEGVMERALPVSSDATAYVMYTSGSTGRPKGVAVPHRAVIRLVYGLDRVTGPPLSRFLQLSPLAFDASTFDLWVPLLRGGCCVLFDGGDAPEMDAIARCIRRHDIECLWLTAAFFNTIVDTRPDALAGVRDLFIGGETLSPVHVAKAQRALPDVRIINGYGPTEATTFTCCHVIERPSDQALPIPIGRPLGSTRVLILDERGQVVPIGVAGELHVGGDGLARGYWQQPELTAQKFIAHPLAGSQDGRLYRTGDRARWRKDGAIDFLGRKDRQIKVRGFRIELEEIEAELRRHPGVRQAVVDVRRDGREGVLEAFVAAADGLQLEASDLRSFLGARLPDYMVPSRFAVLAELKLTANGKIDRTLLPDLSAPPSGAQRPNGAIEETLATIWTETLGAEPLGVHQNFFEAGGHSLMAAQMLARVENALGLTLPISTLFHAPTIALLARAIEEAGPVRRPVLVPLRLSERAPAIVFVHPLGGEVWSYLPLARRLAPEWQSYGLQLPQFEANTAFPTVEALASIYVDALQREVAAPYVIAGYSSGATIAFEVAQQLRARGAAVDMVIALDGGLSNSGPGARGWRQVGLGVANLPHWIRYDLLVTPAGEMAIRLRVKLSQFVEGARSVAIRRAQGAPMNGRRGVSSHRAAVQAYQPRKYDGRVMVVTARAAPLLGSFDAEVGWKRMASGRVSAVTVPGSHETFLREPHVQRVAGEIRRLLAK